MVRLLSAMAAVAVIGLASGAWAQDDSAKSQDQATGQQADTQQITGKVLKASKDQVILEYEGAAVPFRVSKDTRIQGVTSIRNLEEGQQVRASFDLKENQNQLKSLTLMPSGTGGAGEEKSDEVEPKSDQKTEDEQTY